MRAQAWRTSLAMGLALQMVPGWPSAGLAASNQPVSDAAVAGFVDSGDLPSLRAIGPSVMKRLASLYPNADAGRRVRIAQAFYGLGWKSPEAKRVLMTDVHTPDQSLRLHVQWALGRVSADPDVIEVLLDNMRHDALPLFRDKAACALAYDQIHLAPAQKMRLYGGLIDALDDGELQVRAIAALALQILTGQHKGYFAGAVPEARQRAIAEWKRWLRELEANL